MRGSEHFASKAIEREPKTKGLRSPVDRRAPADAAAYVAVRDGFGSQASGLPLKHKGPIEAAPTKACATDETPTAPRPTIGTPPLKERRRQESHREDDGGAFHQ